jgi:4-amino-4-deoxy-L-arabinose transferase-like glycosyltransferase
VRYLFALPDSIPHPDSYWSPLFPLMLSGAFKAVGTSFHSGQLVTLVFGALVPVVVFFLAFGLTRSRAAAVIAGAIAVFQPTMITSSSRVMPEIVMIFFIGLALAILLKRTESHAKEAWLGMVLGLAYLLKYQNGALVVPVVAYYALVTPRRAVMSILIVGAFAAMVAAPWLVRNAVVFGDPFYSIVRSGIVSYYPEFAGEARFVATLQEPPPAWPYIFSHLGDAKALAHTSLYTVVVPFFREYAGSMVLIPFVALGFVAMGSAWRRWLPLVAFAAFIVGFFAITMPLVRYVLVLLPVWVAFAAAGTGVVLRVTERSAATRWAGRVAVVALVGFVCWGQLQTARATATNTGSEWTPATNFGMLEAESVADFIDTHTDSSDVVMAAETYHYAFVLDRPAVQMPFDEELLRYLRDRYHIRYLVTSVRDLDKHFPSWREHTPAWARLVYTVPAADIPRPAWNPTYAHVSEMRVYELR